MADKSDPRYSEGYFDALGGSPPQSWGGAYTDGYIAGEEAKNLWRDAGFIQTAANEFIIEVSN